MYYSSKDPPSLDFSKKTHNHFQNTDFTFKKTPRNNFQDYNSNIQGFSLPKRNQKIRTTDHTEEPASERSPSRSGFSVKTAGKILSPNYQPQHSSYGQSRCIQKNIVGYNREIVLLTQQEQTVIQLRERLRNINHFYRIRIEEQRKKNLERNEVFIGVIEDLQRMHNQKLARMQGELNQMEEEKKDVEYVDQRMERIQTTIEEILTQSKELKEANESYQEEIIRRQAILKEKGERERRLKEEVEVLRGMLESSERMKLKQMRRNKQLLELIDNCIRS